MEWSDYRQALARGWWLIVVLGLAGLAIGILLPKTVVQPQYQTTTSIGAPPSVDGGATSPLPPGVTTEQIQFFAASDSVYAEAGRLAHINAATYTLRGMVTVTGPTDGGAGQPGVIQVQVTAPTAAESSSLNIAYDEALDYAVADGALKATGQDVYTGFQILETTDPGFAVPTKTVVQKFSSRPLRVVAGLLIGLLLGTLVALARGLLDKRVSSAKRAQAALGYPVVAELPAESSDSSEAYRMLWLSVFREPLPEAVDQGDQWLEGADLRLDSGTWPGSEP